jgi:hypothetical protein
MKKYISLAICGAIVATSVGVFAQGRVSVYAPQGARLRFAEPWRPNTTKGDTRIIGTVIDIGQNPVSRARLQLRDLTTGNIQQESESNENGEYEFNVIEPGTYVVEMVMIDGVVVALSNAGSLGRFETLQTVIQLPGRWNAPSQTVIMPQNFTNFVGMSAENTMTAATISIAVDQNIPPADPGEPVSP